MNLFIAQTEIGIGIEREKERERERRKEGEGVSMILRRTGLKLGDLLDDFNFTEEAIGSNST